MRTATPSFTCRRPTTTSSGASAFRTCSITAPLQHWLVRFSEAGDFGRPVLGGDDGRGGGRGRCAALRYQLRLLPPASRGGRSWAVSAFIGTGRRDRLQAA